MHFFFNHFDIILTIFVMIIWHWISPAFLTLPRHATVNDKVLYSVALTIERWLGYFVIWVAVYINSF